MTRRHLFRTVITACVLSAVLSLGGFAQSVEPGALKVETVSGRQAFRITPVRPIAELRAEALKAKPPEETGPFLYPMLTEVTEQNSKFIHLDIRYATTNNFLGEPVYEQPRAFLQALVVSALRAASMEVQKKGYGLVLYDAYRPWFVTKIFWEATPVEKREFVGNPAKGSGHNRGCAVDLSLYDLKNGSVVAMPSEYDEMTPRAYADYSGATPSEKQHREILRKAMEKAGFVQRPNEWWHYDYRKCEGCGILNTPFNRISHVVYLVGNGVTAPKVLKRVDPQFNEEARKKNIQGKVVLFIVIDEDGNIRDIVPEKMLGHGLDGAVIWALRQWKFQPGMLDGKPVAVGVNVETNFRLD